MNKPNEKTAVMQLDPSQAALFALIATPILWILGLDQLFWFGFFPYLAFWLYKQKADTFELRQATLLSLLFLLFELISIKNVAEPMRLFTFCRNWLTHATALFFFLGLLHTFSKSPRRIESLLRVLGLFGLCTGVLGLAAFWFHEPWECWSARWIPDSLKIYPSVHIQFTKALGAFDFWKDREVIRVQSIFTHPTSYALSLLCLFPFLSYGTFFSKRKSTQVLCAIALFSNTIAFYFTYTRSAWVALFCSTFVVLWMGCQNAAIPRLGMLAIGSLFPGFFILSWKAKAIAYLLVLGRGSGSINDRLVIYTESLWQMLEHPWIGWGTQRSSLGLLPYPAGSHSLYVGALYKYGILGGFLWLGIFYQLFKMAQARLEHPSTRPIALCFLMSLFGVLFQGLTEELDLDSVSFFIFWIIAGFSLGGPLQRAEEDRAFQTQH